MNKQQRAAVTARIVDILRAHGATIETDDRPEYRETHIAADFAGVVKLGMDVDDKTQPFASWHSAQAWLSRGVFVSVNECHGRKATTCCADWPTFYTELAAICGCIAAGKAFRAAAA
jgi:hypothetical protein